MAASWPAQLLGAQQRCCVAVDTRCSVHTPSPAHRRPCSTLSQTPPIALPAPPQSCATRPRCSTSCSAAPPSPLAPTLCPPRPSLAAHQDPAFSYAKLCYASALLRELPGVHFVQTNPDDAGATQLPGLVPSRRACRDLWQGRHLKRSCGALHVTSPTHLLRCPRMHAALSTYACRPHGRQRAHDARHRLPGGRCGGGVWQVGRAALLRC